MIRVVRGDLVAADAECLLRPVSGRCEAVSAVGRRMEAEAGPAVARRLESQGDVPVGTAILTPGGELAASFIIHVVVQSPEEPVTSHTVQRGLVNALRRAADFGIESVALPPMGLGAGNLDVEESAKVIVDVIRNHEAEGRPPADFRIVVESEYESSVFQALLDDGAD